MSHGCAMVILSPSYEFSLDESLEKYSEYLDVPEYIKEEVSNYDKVVFLNYYCNKQNEDKEKVAFVKAHEGEEGYKSKVAYESEYGRIENERYVYLVIRDHEEEFADYWIALHKDLWENFENEYKEHGDDWNGNSWRVNPETNKWCEYSTYNPDSVYDYYVEGWDSTLKTKSGEFVDSCLLGEIDWSPFKPEDYCKKMQKDWRGNEYRPLKKNVKWHWTEEDVPSCVFIDGELYRPNKLGWWAITYDQTMTKEEWNKKFFELIKDLPEDSEVQLINYHI